MNRRRGLCFLVVAMLLAGSVGACAQTETATAQGFGGTVSVTLTVEDGVITEVTATGDGETQGIGSAAVEQLPDKILKSNRVDVDGIAGASITSAALLSAAQEALSAMGLSAADLKAAEAAPQSDGAQAEDVVADVVVVGGGGAGVAAAMAARDQGKSVVLLEKLSFLGGNTAMSGGVMTRGAIEGDPEGTMTKDELYDFYMEATGGMPDPQVVRTYVEESADTLAWAHSMGSGVQETQRYRTTPENIMAVQAVGSGRGLMEPMIEGVMASGADVRLNTPATSLIVEDGRVVGVVATNQDGQSQNFYGKGGVVLATGGFPASPELLAKYSSLGAERAIALCSAGTVGDGLVMAEAIGAAVRFGEDWDNIGSNSELTAPYMAAFPQLYALLVNDAAERIISEDAQRPTIYKEMLHQIADGVNGFWFVFDANTIGEGAEDFVQQGSAVKADTLEELANLMGVPTETFLKTVERYNQLAGTDDPDFAKPAKFMLGVKEGPFYAAKTWPVRTSTIGGLVIDKDARVLDENDQPIPGLYAGGEVANYSFFHSVYATCGSAVGHAIVFGRIAGTNAALESA